MSQPDLQSHSHPHTHGATGGHSGHHCCDHFFSPAMARRRFLQLSGAAVGGGLLTGWITPATAASGNYDAMLVNCIDPRFTTEHFNAIATLDGVRRDAMTDNYSHFVIAGGALGAVHPAFKKWHDTVWENLAVSVQLHKIRRVVGLTHRDCGAAKIALGEAAVANREAETQSHGQWLKTFAASVRERHPQLQVVTGIIDFDGSIEQIPA